jgi:hypothetical protein
MRGGNHTRRDRRGRVRPAETQPGSRFVRERVCASVTATLSAAALAESPTRVPSRVGSSRAPRHSLAAASVKAPLGLWALVLLLALGGALAFGDAPALAAYYHKYEAQIAGGGPMTVDGGDLLVNEGSRLAEYDASSDALVSQLLPSSVGLEGFGFGVAVGHGTGETEMYTGTSGEAIGVLGVGSCGTVECAVLQKEWKGTDTPNKSFIYNESGEQVGNIRNLAIDNSASSADWAKGDVFVSTSTNYRGANQNVDVVDVFKPEAGGGEKYVTQLSGALLGGEPFEPGSVAVSEVDGDVLVVNDPEDAVDIFEPTGLDEYVLVRRLTGPSANAPFVSIAGVAVDGPSGTGAGDIFVFDQKRFADTPEASDVVWEFSPTGEFLDGITGTPSESFSNPGPIAVDPTSGQLFVNNSAIDVFSGAVVVPGTVMEGVANAKYESESQTWALDLTGSVNPDGAGSATCRFAWGRTRALGNEVPCEGAGESAANPVPNGTSPVGVHGGLSGLAPDTTYYYRLQASNENGPNEGEEAQDQEFTTGGPGVHGESVSGVTSVSATLNAEIDPNNAPTTYYFQLGTGASYDESVPAAPGAVLGSSKGDLNASVHLQGLRAGTVYHYRVVAVDETGGEVVVVDGPEESFTTQVASTEFTLPDGRAWELVTPPNKQGAGIIAIGNEQGDDIQAAQSGDGITYGATAPFVANPAGNRSPEVAQVISLRDAPGMWSTQDITTPHNEGAIELAIGHSAEYKLFSSDLSLGFVEPMGHTPLPPLPVGSEKTVYLREAGGGYEALVTSANVPSDCKFGGNEEGAGRVHLEDGTPDMNHVLLGIEPECESPDFTPGLYEWSAGKLEPVGVLPSKEVVSTGLAGVRRAVSNDGSRVVWSYGNTLYLRDMVKGETVPIAEEASFQIGSSEGSRVFFTAGDRSLNVFEVTSGSTEPLAGKATRLTQGAVSNVVGAGEDGSDVYFVSGVVLGDGAEHGAESGGHNLYVEGYDEAAKAWKSPVFIALLSSEDSQTWGPERGLQSTTVRVSPNGRYLAFMSDRSLTGYENRDANSGVPDEEVFLYDAETGHLVCASCDPTGARPVGLLEGGGYDENLVDYAKTWEGRWIAANVPGWTTESLGAALYQSRYLSSNGRLFFNSSDALVPADVNGKEDVYEYEPVGVGSCQPPGYGQSASEVFVEGIGGCIGLISAGTSAEESAFMDASEGGGDVFFLTLSRLSQRDYDTSIDIYDAHECTAAARCAPAVAATPPPCTTGDSCKPAPSPQPAIFGAPSSETFSGAGNIVPAASTPVVTSRALTRNQKLAQALRACGRKPKRKRAVCVRQARRKYGTISSRSQKSLSVRAGRSATKSGGAR